MTESTATDGHILVIGGIPKEQFEAVTKEYLIHLRTAGCVDLADKLETAGVVCREDAEEYEAARQPSSMQNSEEKLAARVAMTAAARVGAVVFPCEMLQYGTPYGQRPQLLVDALRERQRQLGLPLTIAYAIRADGSILRLR